MGLIKSIKKRIKRYKHNPFKAYIPHVRHSLKSMVRMRPGNNSAVSSMFAFNDSGGYKYNGRTISELM